MYLGKMCISRAVSRRSYGTFWCKIPDSVHNWLLMFLQLDFQIWYYTYPFSALKHKRGSLILGAHHTKEGNENIFEPSAQKRSYIHSKSPTTYVMDFFPHLPFLNIINILSSLTVSNRDKNIPESCYFL